MCKLVFCKAIVSDVSSVQLTSPMTPMTVSFSQLHVLRSISFHISGFIYNLLLIIYGDILEKNKAWKEVVHIFGASGEYMNKIKQVIFTMISV